MQQEEIEGLTIGRLLDVVAERRPEDDALVYVDRGLRYSYAELKEVVERCARALMALGLRKGDHLAVWGQNVPEWVTLQFATGKIGVVLVTVNPAYQAKELRYVLEQSDAMALFLTEGVKGANFVEILEEAVPELADASSDGVEIEGLPYLKRVVLIGDESPLSGVTSYEEFLKGAEEVSEESLLERQDSLQADEVMNIQYTSGTPGFPKGVQLTHANMIKNAFYSGECMELGAEDRVCIPVLFFNCFGCVLGTLNTVVHEGTMVPVETFEPGEVLEAVYEQKCTALLGVPAMFMAVIEHPDFEEFATASLRTGILAGSSLRPIEVMKKVVDVMGADEITVVYGQTEASPVITQTRTKDPIQLRVSTVGRALPNVEVRLVDVEAGEDCAPGEQGELWTRGYHVMKGYYKMSGKTEEVIDEDGWLHTGDLATMDEAGYVKITGRANDIIIRGSENIYPREIEEFLYTHPEISDVQVFSVPDEKYGEQVAAAIILEQDATLTAEDVKEYCRQNLSSYKVPEYVDFVAEYPRTASGRIQKYKLRESLVERYSGGRISRRSVLLGAAATFAVAPMILRPIKAYAARARHRRRRRRSAGSAGSPAKLWQHGAGTLRGIDIAVVVGRLSEARFGLMFKNLPPFAPSDDLLISLAGQMVDPRPPAPDVSEAADAFDNPDTPSGFTFLGQFIDHDMTRDTTPLSSQQVDPHGLTNFDTPMFDLGSVYGRGPELDPQLYDPSQPGALLLVEHDGVLDLPRSADGTALLGDPRNDENLIICQLQIAFIKLHNAFLAEGRSFASAQQLARWHYQWVIVHDFLPHIVGQDVVDGLLVQTGAGLISTRNTFYIPRDPVRPMMPVEYSAAAYRFGHSMIRPEYEAHDGHTRPIFGPEGGDLRGSRPLPPDMKIDWTYFFDVPGMPVPMGRNFARLIDTKLSLPLASLPPTVVAPAPGAVTALAERNLLRGKQVGLSSGQDVAQAMGITPLSNADLGLTDAGWGDKAPLWFYILKEAELGGGKRLGPVGGRIVAEVILGLLALDKTSYFNAKTQFSPVSTDFRMGDLLRFAGSV